MIGPSATTSVVHGATLTRILQGHNEDGTIPSEFLVTDTLTGTVWLAQAEPALISFVPVWFNAALCQVTITLTQVQTALLDIDALYNVQIFASRAGVTYCIDWISLQVLPAAGMQASAIPPDLVTGPYAAQLLASLVLTPAQLEMIPTLITAASNAIRSWCNRDFTQAVYREDCPVELNGTIRLRNPPINQITRVQAQPTPVLTVTNPSTSVQAARCYFTMTGDVTGGQTITGMTLVSVSNGVSTTTPIAYTANETISGLAAAIAAVPGWLAVADSVLGLWPVTELLEGAIAQGAALPDQGAVFSVLGVDLTGVRFHPDDGQLTGIIWCGQQYQGFGPRWGPGWEEFDDVAQGSSWGIVRVTYNGGFAKIPAQIQLGCVELVKLQIQRLRTDLLLVSETAGQYSYTINPRLILALPPEVLGGISAYRIHNA